MNLNEYNALIDEHYPELQIQLATVHMNLGECLIHLGKLSTAEIHYNNSLTLLQNLQKNRYFFLDTVEMVRDIANWYCQPQRPMGTDKPYAFDLVQTGLNWLDTLLNRVSDISKGYLIEKNIELQHFAINLALELDPPNPTQAYIILERSKSKVLLEQMLRECAEIGYHIDNELRKQYYHLKKCQGDLVRQLALSAPIGCPIEGKTRFISPTLRSTNRKHNQKAQLWQQLQTIEQELDQVRRTITEQEPAFGEAIHPRPLEPEQITTLIPVNTLAIAFEQRPTFLHLYIITTEGVHTPLKIDLDEQQLTKHVNIFRQNITGKTCADTVLKIRNWLTEKLASTLNLLLNQWQPQKILFIPHQAWHLLPLHLIQIDGEPLTLRYQVRYIPSLQVLRLISERNQANTGEGCIIANPDGTLPSAKNEGETVKKCRPTDVLLEGKEAMLDTVRQHLEIAQHGHFACHGYFQPDLKAGLRLVDGSLQAKELFASLRLPNPRLIVLSACETAQIQPTIADEYMGLVSGFLFAGTHNVLAALWRVDDESTRLLMEDFYQGLAEGLSPTLALQKAQQQLREMHRDTVKARLQTQEKMSKTPFKNPYYWAGFLLVGDGR